MTRAPGGIGDAVPRAVRPGEAEDSAPWLAEHVGARQQNKAVFDRLRAGREAIESEPGEAPAWRREDRLKMSRLEFRRRISIRDASAGDLGELKRWAADLLPRLRGAFGPRIASIDLDGLTAGAHGEAGA